MNLDDLFAFVLGDLLTPADVGSTGHHGIPLSIPVTVNVFQVILGLNVSNEKRDPGWFRLYRG